MLCPAQLSEAYESVYNDGMKPFVLHKRLDSPILITCEHASSRIPRELGTLGLTREQLGGAKDLYDPGSEALARSVARQLNCSVLISTTSRLVIDYNRRLDMQGVADNAYHAPALKAQLLTDIAGREVVVPIPGNLRRSPVLEKQRYRQYVLPFQQAGMQLVSDLVKLHGTCVVLSVHSFYPVYAGKLRTVDIDVLYDASRTTGKALARLVRRHTRVRVAENKPWSLRDADGGVFKALQSQPGVALLAVDVNNIQLKTVRGVSGVARTLVLALQGLVAPGKSRT